MSRQERLRFGELGAKHIGWTFRDLGITEVFLTSVHHDRHRTTITGVEVSNGLPNLVTIERHPTDEVTVSYGARLATVGASWEGTHTDPETTLSLRMPPGHYTPSDSRRPPHHGWTVEAVEGPRIKLTRH